METLADKTARELTMDFTPLTKVLVKTTGDRNRAAVEATLGRASDGAVAVPDTANKVYVRIRDSAEEVEAYYPPGTALDTYLAGVIVWVKRRKNRWEFDGFGTVENEVQLPENVGTNNLNLAPFWIAQPFSALPVAYAISDLANGLLKHASGVPALAVVSTDYLAPNTGTNVVNNTMIVSLAASKLTGQVAVANGGTGASTLTANNLIVGNGMSAVTFIAPGSSGNILQSNGTVFQSVAPSFNASVITAGVLALARGGTNADNSGLTTGALIAKGATTLTAASLTAKSIVIGQGTGAPTGLAPGTNRNVAISDGTDWTSRALINDDITGALSEPPPIGDVTPNTGDFTDATADTFLLAGFHSNNATVTITATSDTTMMTSGLTWLANYFTQGRSVRFWATGFIDTGTNKATTWRLKFDGSTLVTITFPAATTGANAGWWVEGIVTCMSTGGSGTFRAQMWGAQATVFRHGVMTGTHADDTAATISPDFTMAFSVSGTGSPTMTCTNLIFQPLS